MSFENNINIDKYNLDIEWVKQPTLIAEYSNKHTEAQKKFHKVKEILEQERARLTKAITQNPQNFGINKTTVVLLESVIVEHPDYIKAKQEMIQAQYEMNIFANAVKAIEHKKTALENIVKLHLSGYYSTPKTPDKEKFNDTELTRKEIRKRIKERKRLKQLEKDK